MTFEKVRNALAEQLGIDPEEITMETNISDDLQADSLDLVDLVIDMEDEFGVEFPEDDIDSIKTVGDVVNFIEENK